MTSFFRKKTTITFLGIIGFITLFVLFSYLKLAIKPVEPLKKNPPVIERGSIVDRAGQPLAIQTNYYRIGLNTKDIRLRAEKDASFKQDFIHDMSIALEMSEDEIASIIDSRRDEFVYLKKRVPQEMYRETHDVTTSKSYSFVSYEKEVGRTYPNNSLASQLIGFYGADGKGLEGIEFSQQDILSPPIDYTKEVPEQGKNVYLTIDANLQYKLEQIALKAKNDTQAESIMLVAADCRTGELLSLISLPSANLNEYGTAPLDARMNKPVVYAYEPGSVFKIFTVGLVHDERGISPNDTFLCDGSYERKLSSGETIRIKCLDRHGWITPREALKYSCNDVLGQISDKVSDTEFINRLKLFGFGSKTGIELSGENPGLLRNPSSKSWSARSKQTIAIGQELTVTALQMVQAATAIANDGVPVKLSVIKKITNKDNSIYYEHVPEQKDRVLSKASADYVLSCMETTASTGTGSRANIGDVQIGVKTGTAQMADPVKGGYSDTDFISNCMAIFPTNKPQIVLYIVISKAKGETYAGRIVAPVIAEAANTIIDYMGMSREGADSIEHDGIINIAPARSVKIDNVVPDFYGYSKKELLPLLSQQKVNVKINGSGWVTSQNPIPGTPVTENMVIELNLE